MRMYDGASASLNYRVCLLFNRSAEEVMPQSMSQPSCIIAPLCHCQGPGRATSDCFPLFSFPLCLFISSLQSVFSLGLLTYPAETDRVRQTKSEHIEYTGVKTSSLHTVSFKGALQKEIRHSINQE